MATGQSSPAAMRSAEVAQIAAMPDMERLTTLQRYQTSLDRQLSKIIGEIRVINQQNPSNQVATQIPLQHVSTRHLGPTDSIIGAIDKFD